MITYTLINTKEMGAGEEMKLPTYLDFYHPIHENDQSFLQLHGSHHTAHPNVLVTI